MDVRLQLIQLYIDYAYVRQLDAQVVHVFFYGFDTKPKDTHLV